MNINDRIADAINPLYKAPIILCELPNLTKKVPRIEATKQLPPIAIGYRVIICAVSPLKKIVANTMVATIVTA